MAYLYADTSNKVGFRPYHQTDPFGAAHLSGIRPGDSGGLGASAHSQLGQNHPFKPEAWHLHGVDGTFLGTYHLNRPFDPWELYADVHETSGVQGGGLSGLGDAVFRSDVTARAADELLSAGHITQAEHDAILEGSMTFQDVLGYDPTDQSSWNLLTNLFREVNQDLQSLEQNPVVAAQLGRELIARRNQYSDLASQFIQYYTLLAGSAPSGLSGLGFVWANWIAGAAVFVVLAFAGLYALRNWSKSIDVSAIQAKTQQAQAGTDQQLADTLARQQAAGDTVGANATIALMKQRASQISPGSTEKWLMDNAKWIGLGAGALIVLGPLSQGLFGRRR